MNLLTTTETEAQACRLLELAELDAGSFHVTPLRGGRNNRVSRIDSSAGVHLLKEYQHNPQDLRDRLAHETAFLRHLGRAGCSAGPHLFASVPAEHIALLEFIEGAPLRISEIGEAEVDQAIDFFLGANAESVITTPAARELPPASEACFSIATHLATTQRRVDRLTEMLVNDEVDSAARHFVARELIPAWAAIRAAILGEWPQEEERDASFPSYERCLSPSDFGFHNALRQPDGRIRFLDFEYAGWDDPAKLICDFMNQPDMLLPRALGNRFRDAVISVHRNPESLHRRVLALRPLYQLKWACICLNDFLPLGRERLAFTHGPGTDSRQRREAQLARARQMLGRATASATTPPFSS